MADISTTILRGQSNPEAQDVDDEALAQAAKQNSVAFAELYHRHVDRVYRYLLLRVGNVQEAQDLTAQTFLAAFESIAGYRGQSKFTTWLMGIARHKAVDYFRRKQETLPLDAAVQMPHPAPPLEERVTEQLRLDQVAQALRDLSPDRAEAIALRIFARLSTAEVSQVMGKSEPAVRMLVHRAVRDLRERLSFVTEE